MKDQPHRPSGLRRLVLPALAVAMVAVALVAFFTYRAYQQAGTELVLQRDQQLAQLSAARLRAELGNFAENLVDLSRSNDMFSGKAELQRAALRGASSRLTLFDGGVLILNDQGHVIASEPNRPELFGIDLSSREYFQALLGDSSLFISDSVADGPDGQPVIAIAVPIQGSQGEFIGGLIGFFQLGEETNSAFYASLVRLRLGQTGSTYLFDGQARILFDSNRERIGHFLSTAQLSQISSLRQAGAMRTSSDEGAEIVAALAPVPNTDWTLVIEDDWRIITSSTRRYSNIFFLSLAMGLLLPPIGVAVLTRQRRFQRFLPTSANDDERIASHLRHAIKPSTLPMIPGWEIAVRHRGGSSSPRDYHDAAILSDGRLLLALGKARGPALEAALSAAQTHAIMRSAAEQQGDPVQAMSQCNRLLASRPDDNIHVSHLTLVIDPISGHYQFCSAGEAQPMISDLLAGSHEWMPGETEPLGHGLNLSLESGQGVLEPGQIMLLASNEALEARGLEGEAFIDDVLLDILRQPPDSLQRLASLMMSEYNAFTSGLPAEIPELTLMLLQRMPYDRENGGGAL